ncbi:MAG: mechanosensitive ion channel, partial [Pseudomonadales bacterium]|nr:mechanosensitive ion channel [Pseudomonadales bacterium]
LNQVIAILLISLGGAAALAFGLGSREVAGNILAGTYARELYREGDRLVIGAVSGTVTQVTAVKLELRTESGDLITLPNAEVVNATVTRLHGQ